MAVTCRGTAGVHRSSSCRSNFRISGDVDTDILFDYGILTPRCRRADLADMRRLQMDVGSRMPHLSGDRLFLDRNSRLAKLRDAVRAINRYGYPVNRACYDNGVDPNIAGYSLIFRDPPPRTVRKATSGGKTL